MQVQILLRFTWQCVAVILLHRYRKDIPQPFVMWLYPFPALLSLALWIYIFFTGPAAGRVVLGHLFFLLSVGRLLLLPPHPGGGEAKPPPTATE